MSSQLEKQTRQYYAYFNQGEVWVPKDKPPIRIADMDTAWRYNAAQFLTRRASAYLSHYELGEHLTIWHTSARDVMGELVNLAPSPGSLAESTLERELTDAHEQRKSDPVAWIKSTDLYQALTHNLTSDAADLAKHWSGCAIRNDGGQCTCRERHLSECPKRDDIDEPCHCSDTSPEWTR